MLGVGLCVVSVIRDDVSANQALADGCARARVYSAKNVSRVVALSVEAADGGAVSAQDYTVCVGHEATAGAQVGDDHLGCIQLAV